MAVILAWNQVQPSSDGDADPTGSHGNHTRCSVGRHQGLISPGERVFLLRYKDDEHGLIAAGWATSEVYLESRRGANHAGVPYVDIEWSHYISSGNSIALDQLLIEAPEVDWENILSLASSSLTMRAYSTLERLWARAVGDWSLRPGQYLSRSERVHLYGGAMYGGIEPSAKTPNVFVYSDPAAGHRSGYIFDGWSQDGSVYLYTGEGQVGDQQLIDGNKALLEHKSKGRIIRLFVADGTEPSSTSKKQLYVGAFEVDTNNPFLREDAPDRDGQPRQVLVFRLRPLGGLRHLHLRTQDNSLTGDACGASEATLINVEAANQYQHNVPAKVEGTATRTEAILSRQYQEHLRMQGVELKRWQLRTPSGLGYLYTDLYDGDQHELYEAKSSAKRESIRQAVGQLLDYRRFLPESEELRMSLLLPTRPSADMLDFLQSVGIECVYKDAAEGTFVRVR